MIQFAVDGVTSFSTAPLRLATWLGDAASLLAFIYLASVVVQKLMGITVQGFACGRRTSWCTWRRSRAKRRRATTIV